MVHGRGRGGSIRSGPCPGVHRRSNAVIVRCSLPPQTAVAGLCGLNRAVRSGRGDLPGECAAMSESVRRRLCAEWRKGDLPRASGSKRPAGLRGEQSVIRSRRGRAAYRLVAGVCTAAHWIMQLWSPCVIVMSERRLVPKLDVAGRTLRPYWLYELSTTNCQRSRARTSEPQSGAVRRLPSAIVVRGARLERACQWVGGRAHLRVSL